MREIQKVAIQDLDFSDPIFSSLRDTYPEFDAWTDRIRGDSMDTRYALVCYDNHGLLEGVAIVKRSDSAGGTKLCTLKVVEHARGQGLGSSLVDNVVQKTENTGSDRVFVDFYPNLETMEFFRRRQFQFLERTSTSEVRYVHWLSSE